MNNGVQPRRPALALLLALTLVAGVLALAPGLADPASAAPSASKCAKSGRWLAQYYKGTAFKGKPTVTRCEKRIAASYPASRKPFSVRWSTTRTLKGAYEIRGRATGKAVLRVDGRTVATSTKGRYAAAVRKLRKGKHTLEVRYVKKSGAGSVAAEYVKSPDRTAPATVTGVRAVAGDRAVALSWKASTALDLRGYRVYRGGRLLREVATPRFTDTGLANGTAYSYAIVAVDHRRNASRASAAVRSTPRDKVAPKAPTGLVADAGDSKVSLAWKKNAEFDLAGYVLRRTGGTSGPKTWDLGKTATTATDSSAVNGTAYVYSLVARDTSGNSSSPALVAAMPIDRSAPATPSGLTAAAGDGEVALSWNANTEPDLDGYVITRTRADGGGVAIEITAGATDTTLTDSSAKNGVAYLYTIRAVDRRGNASSDSTPVPATPAGDPGDQTPPDVPTGLEVEEGDGEVALSWDANTEDDLDGYTVYRKTGAGPYVEIADVDADTTSYTDESAENDTLYTYAVAAFDKNGNTSALTEGITATPTDTTPPAAPATPTATAGDGQVALTWTASTESDLAGYRVYRATTADVPTTGDGIGGPGLVPTASFTDEDATNGTTYYYVVVAVDTHGNPSDPSGSASATPVDGTAPAAPTGLEATAAKGEVTLDWADSAEADLDHYAVYRSLVGAAAPLAEEPPIAEVDDSEYVDTTVDPGTTYAYWVVAVDATGNASAASETVEVTTPEVEPEPVHEKFVFQPAAGPGVSGYTKHTGTPWSDAAGDGFVREDSLSATHVPLDMTTNTRSRTRPAPVTALQNSLIHLQYGAATPPLQAGQNTVSGAFELAVPDGWYAVKVSVGDQGGGANGYDSTHVVNVEGEKAIDAFKSSAAKEYETATTTVEVIDGRLTLDAIGGINTKLNYVEVDSTDEPEPPVEVDQKYVFTTAADNAVPAGWTKNSGAAWTDASGLGWVTQASLAATTHEPLDLTKNGRLRTRPAPVTALQNRLIHLQYGDVASANPANGNLVAGAFERAVPDGWYEVAVSVGDQMGSTAYDSLHTIRAEGVTVVGGFQATAAKEYEAATSVVHVTDGRLTIDAIGGTNTKMNHLAIVSADAPTEPDVHRAVRFADEASAPPAGYLKDFGEAYGLRTGADQGAGLAYGWRRLGTVEPQSIVGNGRNRLDGTAGGAPVGTPQLRAGTIHMQLPENASQGVKIPAYWELEVPNGAYRVEVSVGDAGTATDSVHWLNVEDQSAVAGFVPTGAAGAATKHATAVRTVNVADGRLTITPNSGTNTKLNWVTVDSVAGASLRPSVRKSTPTNLATGASPTGSVVNDLFLVGSGVAPGSLTSSSVTLTKVANGAAVDANVLTSGGGDVINLSPKQALEPNTLYRFAVTDAVKDVDGHAFLPYSSVFTTGETTGGGGPVAFDPSDSGAPAATGAEMGYSSITKGPDGRMYAATLAGDLYRFDIAADGKLTNRFKITTVRDYSNSAASGDTYAKGTRTVIGLAFDPASTPANPILWITDNAPFIGQNNVPDLSGRLAKLTGPNLGTYTAVLDGIPRSIKDHEANSVAFGPDGALYFNVGANNAMGAADGTWGNREEHPLSAATLRVDLTKLPAQLPVNVRPAAYDPFAANAPVTVYGSGIRNAYDLVWHSNGSLYVPTNGSAAGGNVPAVPTTLPAHCTKRPDGGYGGPTGIAGITSNPNAETDYVFRVRKGKYYGHPNPSRCEYVLNNGNPTAGADPFETARYPVGTAADPNYDLSGVFDAGLHASANGVIEYTSNAFGGALKGKLLYVRYSQGQDIVSFDVAPDGTLSNRKVGTTGLTGFNQPLDLTEDPATGNLYVTQLGNGTIALVKPRGGAGGAGADVTPRLFLSGQTNATSPAAQATVTNTGTETLTIPAGGLTFTGGDAAMFATTTPNAAPITVAPGAPTQVAVTFRPTSVGVKAASLQIATSVGTKTVALRGLGAAGLGGGNEPSLQRIMDTLQIPINVGDPEPGNASMPSTQGPIGDEIAAQLFQKAAFDAPISITPLAAYGPQNNDPAVHVGWYDAGQAAGLHPQFSIKASEAQGLMINPTGSTTNIDPGEETVFGLYSEWPYFSGRKAYTEDALNTWDAALPHHIRVYPYKNADGTVEANAYVVATEEVPGSPFDSQDIVLLVRNVKPYVPAEAEGAVLKAVNLDPVPFADQIAFNRLQTTADGDQKMADTGTVRISNTGTAALQVTGLPITGQFQLVDPPAVPFTVTPGATRDLTVKFVAQSTKVHNGTLTVQSNAETDPLQVIRLGGLWQSQSEGGQEPNLSQIVKAFGIGSVIPNGFASKGEYAPIGDEVLSPYWSRIDTTKPVTVRQLAGFHTYLNGAGVKWHAKGSNTAPQITNMGGQYAQSLLPRASNSVGAGPAAGSFTPGPVFGFGVDNEWTDRAKNNEQVDLNNGCVAPCGQHVRLWPVKDRTGTLVPGSYLLSMDYAGINYDYQDNVYLVTNLRPEVITTPQVVAIPGNNKVTLSWGRNPYDVGVGYRVWRGTTADFAVNDASLISGPTSGDPLSATTYTDPTAVNGTTYYYVVRAVYKGAGNSGDGTASATPTAAAQDVDVKVDFGNEAATLPAGYLKDFGQAFGARTRPDQGTGLTYGWLGETTLQPLDLSVGGTSGPGNGRWRKSVQPDLRLDTFMHMQADDVPNFNGTPLPGRWELAVPNGSYSVTVAVGEPNVNTDPEIHTLNVEGTRAIDAFVPAGAVGSATRHKTATVEVTVEDGRLTLDALGGTNTKIDYVDVTTLN
ncbi:choice-of-anchor D domain-containing protein [Mumia sp. ZJ1417]|uniref:choice-of-anchor D domain-containing protein n=1 Tax=Mumia sp. ZJ1417 TaxID=2708082 RepID=UPI0014236461|nr:choice-of-anchor D domain-containing protein [Mumia sp. ZJ1417]QMW66608.1 choice-of-anchor D domain-containing protein [Mumia sp. ZJ1417]